MKKRERHVERDRHEKGETDMKRKRDRHEKREREKKQRCTSATTVILRGHKMFSVVFFITTWFFTSAIISAQTVL